MEQNLDKILEEMKNTPGVNGCILADKSGLCLGVKGCSSEDNAGVITAIADHAAKLKLEPGSNAPIISLQSDTRQCLIQRYGQAVGAIFKDTSQ